MAKQPEDNKTYDIPMLIGPATQYIEEATAKDAPIAADAILTDQQLERGGLVKVEAFMRTRTSAAANNFGGTGRCKRAIAPNCQSMRRREISRRSN